MYYSPINILSILRTKGRSFTERVLKKFSCTKNTDVENFLKNEAIRFARNHLAETYLVLGTEKATSTESYLTTASTFAVGYFTLTYKVLPLPETIPDADIEKIVSSFAGYPDGSNTRTLASPLIAQFAKNDALPDDVKAEFSGSKLMGLALEQVKHVQDEVGGRTVHLECENVVALTKFYEGQGFRYVGTRTTDKNVVLLQYLKVL